MEWIVSALMSIIYFLVWLIWSIVWWVLSFFIVPLLLLFIIGAIALRFAYQFPYFKKRIDALAERLGDRSKNWFVQLIYSVTVLPIRVIMHMLWLVPLHALVNLLWNPKWRPLDVALEYSQAGKANKPQKKKS